MVKAAQRQMAKLQAEESLRTVAAIAVALGGAQTIRDHWVALVNDHSPETFDPVARDAAIAAADIKVFGAT